MTTRTKTKGVLAAALAVMIFGAAVAVALWAGGGDEPPIVSVSTA